jgi:hypothetical protein
MKHIFIGLGGAGIQIVSQLRDRIADQEDYRYLYVDTDRLSLKEVMAHPDEVLALGQYSPYRIAQMAQMNPQTPVSRQILQEIPPELQLMDRPLSVGTGAIRTFARIAFFLKHEDFCGLLHHAIVHLSPNNDIRYWVVAGSAGGTGSGILCDVLHLINKVHQQYAGFGNPYLGLVLIMPRLYMEMDYGLNMRFAQNAFSLFNELSDMQNFHFCIPIDSKTSDGRHFESKKELYRATATLLYHLHDGSLGHAFQAHLDAAIAGWNPMRGEFLAPVGYISFQETKDEIKCFLSNHIHEDLLQYGLLAKQSQDSEQCEKDAMSLFDGSELSVSLHELRQEVDSWLDKELPHNLIVDESGRYLRVLPRTVSIEAARQMVEIIKAKVRWWHKQQSSRDWEQGLQSWAVSHICTDGIPYVQNVLHSLHSLVLQKKETVLKQIRSFPDIIRGVESELPDLYRAAVEVSIKERITGKNSNDVVAFFYRLRTWAELNVEEETNQAFVALIHRYCDELENIISKIDNLFDESSHSLMQHKWMRTQIEERFLSNRFGITSALTANSVNENFLESLYEGYLEIQPDGPRESFYRSLIAKCLSKRGKEMTVQDYPGIIDAAVAAAIDDPTLDNSIDGAFSHLHKVNFPGLFFPDVRFNQPSLFWEDTPQGIMARLYPFAPIQGVFAGGSPSPSLVIAALDGFSFEDYDLYEVLKRFFDTNPHH